MDLKEIGEAARGAQQATKDWTGKPGAHHAGPDAALMAVAHLATAMSFAELAATRPESAGLPPYLAVLEPQAEDSTYAAAEAERCAHMSRRAVGGVGSNEAELFRCQLAIARRIWPEVEA